MEERDYSFAREYHRGLLEIAQTDALLQAGETPLRSRLPRVMDRFGDLLISLGSRLKERSRSPELSRECV